MRSSESCNFVLSIYILAHSTTFLFWTLKNMIIQQTPTRKRTFIDIKSALLKYSILHWVAVLFSSCSSSKSSLISWNIVTYIEFLRFLDSRLVSILKFQLPSNRLLNLYSRFPFSTFLWKRSLFDRINDLAANAALHIEKTIRVIVKNLGNGYIWLYIRIHGNFKAKAPSHKWNIS